MKIIRNIALVIALMSTSVAAQTAFEIFLSGLKAERLNDNKSAVEFYRLAAEQGLFDAQMALGKMYQDGKGVVQDYAEAIKWYRLAANQGIPSAQDIMGDMYESGTGVEQDSAESFRWYHLAAVQGYCFSQFEIGTAYVVGNGVNKDPFRAHMWLNLPSANGCEFSGDLRDVVAKMMKPEDIAKAQTMASECMSSGYENCGE